MPARWMAPLLSLLLLALAGAIAPAAFAYEFVVTATDDQSGPCTVAHCSLREAITAANAVNDANVIAFNLPVTYTLHCVTQFVCTSTSSVDPIRITSQLPSIKTRQYIDGRTQPSFTSDPLVEIRGPGSGVGLAYDAGSDFSAIHSIAITNFHTGILLANSFGVLVNSRIGVDASGFPFGNTDGVVVVGDDDTIGGSDLNGEGNVISANTGAGVRICNEHNGCGSPFINGTFASPVQVVPATGSNNVIAGNFIGTGTTGNFSSTRCTGPRGILTFCSYGNGDGIDLDSGTATLIGGGDPANGDFRNVISGNAQNGILAAGAEHLIGGNLIGVNAAGNGALGNGGNGITLLNGGAPGTTIGKFAPVKAPCVLLQGPPECHVISGGPNVIGGNAGDGVHIGNEQPRGVSLLGNFIGTDQSATRDLGNSGVGAHVTVSGNNSDNTIGDGTLAGQNTIAFNHQAGVQVDSVSPFQDEWTIRINHIFSNHGLGIQLGASTTPSTLTKLTSVATGNGTGPSIFSGVESDQTIVGNYTIDLYSEPTCDPSGFGQGPQWVAGTTVFGPNPLLNTVSFNFSYPVVLTPGSFVTALVTNPIGGTSEFSNCQTVASTGVFSLNPASAQVDLGQPLVSQLTWTVPAPRVWRDLASIDVRLVQLPGDGHTVMQIHWDEANNIFSLVGESNESHWVSFDLAGATVVGSGPTGPSVTLTLPFTFDGPAAGHAFSVEVAAADKLGNHDDFLPAGIWTVSRR